MRGEDRGNLPVTCAAFIGCRAPVAEMTIANTDRNNRNNPNKEYDVMNHKSRAAGFKEIP